jgi:hypothetical protein
VTGRTTWVGGRSCSVRARCSQSSAGPDDDDTATVHESRRSRTRRWPKRGEPSQPTIGTAASGSAPRDRVADRLVRAHRHVVILRDEGADRTLAALDLQPLVDRAARAFFGPAAVDIGDRVDAAGDLLEAGQPQPRRPGVGAAGDAQDALARRGERAHLVALDVPDLHLVGQHGEDHLARKLLPQRVQVVGGAIQQDPVEAGDHRRPARGAERVVADRVDHDRRGSRGGAPLDRGLDLIDLPMGVVVGQMDVQLEAEVLGALEGVVLQALLVVIEPSQK